MSARAEDSCRAIRKASSTTLLDHDASGKVAKPASITDEVLSPPHAAAIAAAAAPATHTPSSKFVTGASTIARWEARRGLPAQEIPIGTARQTAPSSK